MAATAAAMGAAAAVMRKQEQDIENQQMRQKQRRDNASDSKKNQPSLSREEATQQRAQMKDFEEEFMKMLTRTSLRRFAQADGVPVADTHESILEACGKAGRLLSPQQLLNELMQGDLKSKQEKKRKVGENNEGGDEIEDDDEDDEIDDDEEDFQDQDGEPVEEDDDDEYGEKMRAARAAEQQAHGSSSSASPFRRPFELDFDAKLLTAEERMQLRREHDLRWLDAVPSRLRSWLESESKSKNDTVFLNLDIFTELVVRIPIEGAGKDEVVAFCSPFGNCEYQGPCFNSHLTPLNKTKTRDDKKKKDTKQVNDGETEEVAEAEEHDEEKDKNADEKTKQVQAQIRNETRKFCHIVRFSKGVDAIRCFVELNGFFIDPKQYEDELNSAAVRLCGKKKFFNSVRDTGFLASALGEDLVIKSGESFEKNNEQEDLGRCWTSRFIFITCDFFRASFFNKAGLCSGSSDFIPRSEMTTRSPYEDTPSSSSSSSSSNNNNQGISGFFSSLFGNNNNNNNNNNKKKNSSNSQLPSSFSVANKIPSNWNPADIVCKKLALRAKELIGVYPLAASHKDVEWVGLCRASNCISMFVPLDSNGENKNSSSSSESTSTTRVWVLTLRALRACQINVVALFRSIDAANSVDELMELGWKFAANQEDTTTGSKKQSTTQQSSPRKNDDKNENNNNDSKKNKKVDIDLQEKKKGFWSQFAFGTMTINSPDPAQRNTNRWIERTALVVLVLLTLWIGFVAFGMFSHSNSPSDLSNVKGKNPFASGSDGGSDTKQAKSKEDILKRNLRVKQEENKKKKINTGSKTRDL